jgi:hypothetical protein
VFPDVAPLPRSPRQHDNLLTFMPYVPAWFNSRAGVA